MGEAFDLTREQIEELSSIPKKPEAVEGHQVRLETIKTNHTEIINNYILHHPQLKDKGLFAKDIIHRLEKGLQTVDVRQSDFKLSKRDRILKYLALSIQKNETPKDGLLDILVREELESLSKKPRGVIQTLTQREITPAMLKEKFLASKARDAELTAQRAQRNANFVGKTGSVVNNFFTTGESTDQLWSHELNRQFDKQLDEEVATAKKQPAAPWTTRAMDWLVKKVTFAEQRENTAYQKMSQKEEHLAFVETKQPELYKLMGLLDRLRDEYGIDMSENGSMGFFARKKYQKLERNGDTTFLKLRDELVKQFLAKGTEATNKARAPMERNLGTQEKIVDARLH